MWQAANPYASVDHVRFSALTLGFFDVARATGVLQFRHTSFQCPNAGLLRCGIKRGHPDVLTPDVSVP